MCPLAKNQEMDFEFDGGLKFEMNPNKNLIDHIFEATARNKIYVIHKYIQGAYFNIVVHQRSSQTYTN